MTRLDFKQRSIQSSLLLSLVLNPCCLSMCLSESNALNASSLIDAEQGYYLFSTRKSTISPTPGHGRWSKICFRSMIYMHLPVSGCRRFLALLRSTGLRRNDTLSFSSGSLGRRVPKTIYPYRGIGLAAPTLCDGLAPSLSQGSAGFLRNKRRPAARSAGLQRSNPKLALFIRFQMVIVCLRSPFV